VSCFAQWREDLGLPSSAWAWDFRLKQLAYTGPGIEILVTPYNDDDPRFWEPDHAVSCCSVRWRATAGPGLFELEAVPARAMPGFAPPRFVFRDGPHLWAPGHLGYIDESLYTRTRSKPQAHYGLRVECVPHVIRGLAFLHEQVCGKKIVSPGFPELEVNQDPLLGYVDA